MNAMIMLLNESRHRFVVRRMVHTRATMTGAVLILSLLTVSLAVGQELPITTPSLAEADTLMKEGKYEEAREVYEQACTADPKNATALAGLGNALLKLDRESDALAAYQHALELDPACGRAKVGLARVQCRSGKFSEGFALLETVLNAEAKEPDIPLVQEALSTLNEFRSRIYKSQRVGELSKGQSLEWQKRAYALLERAEIVLGYTVLRLEQELHGAWETEVEKNAGGLAMVLDFMNIEADYDTLMGDSGMAFVWQAETLQKNAGKVEKFLRTSWPFSFVTRVDFLSQILGRRLRLEYLPDYACGAASLRTFNYERVLSAIETEVKAGRPVLGLDTSSMAVAGYKLYADGNLDCFFVHWPGPGAGRLSTFEEYLVGVVAVGEPVPQLDRKEADRLAIQHAVMLGRETLFHGTSFPEAADADGDSGCVPNPEDVVTSRTYYTGCESFALWKDSVKEETSAAYEYRGYAYRDLALLRRSAPVYLRAMVLRHKGDAANALNQAADFYDLVLKELPDLNEYDPENPPKETREEAADRIGRIAALEAEAIESLEEAQRAMR